MNMYFVLEQDNNGYMSPDTAAAWESISANNEWNQDSEYLFTATDINTLGETLEKYRKNGKAVKHHIVPVGSIQFCNIMGYAIGCRSLPALNVPEELADEAFAGRPIFRCRDKGELHDVLMSSEPKQFIVKPDNIAKRFEAQLVRNEETAIGSFTRQYWEPYFVSERIMEDIVAEWRIFFWRDEIIEAEPYYLGNWACPDERFVSKALETWKTGKPYAGTLDIAILDSGKNIVIEAHPLIACGLYGFEGPSLPPMLNAAWKWYVENYKLMDPPLTQLQIQLRNQHRR